VTSRGCWLGGACLVLTAACRPSPPPPPPALLTVAVANGRVAAPDTFAAGWTRVHVEDAGGGHIVVLFRIPGELAAADFDSLRVVMDTARTTPRGVVTYGGPEVADAGDIILELDEGRYLLGCVSRGEDGHRHLAAGEWRVLIVPAGTSRTTEPVASREVRMADFAYAGPATWPAGQHLIRVVNAGQELHQLRIDRLRPGVTLQQWFAAGDSVAVSDAVAGAARMSPQRTVFLPMSLTRGEYVLYCLISDPTTGRMHVELGMFRGIKVE
jgi:hypothetical protein